METSFSIDAPAKVNLCLAVEYPPRDGYHALESVFTELALHDTLHFEVCGIDDCVDDADAAATRVGTVVALDCPLASGAPLPTADNLVFKAIDALEAALKRPILGEAEALRIRVDKRIPDGGGLGGGSSNAAAALKACCRLLGLDPLDERVLGVARSLGADVAFFLHGGCALMDGRGDTLVRRLPAFPLPIVLMGEDSGISTGRIYRDFDADPVPAPSARDLAAAIESFPAIPTRADKTALARLCANNLEPAAVAALPRLGSRIERACADEDVLHALVTGSGATSYAICADEGAAMRFERRAAAYCSWTAIC